MQKSMFSSEEPPASRSASLGFVKVWLTQEGILHFAFLEWLSGIAPNGSSGRTSLGYCQADKDGILVPSSGRWRNSGMGSLTASWTLNTGEWPNDAVVSSLSQITETGDVPQRYYLTKRACAGILRRAEKRGKKLPEQLAGALETVLS